MTFVWSCYFFLLRFHSCSVQLGRSVHQLINANDAKLFHHNFCCSAKKKIGERTEWDEAVIFKTISVINLRMPLHLACLDANCDCFREIRKTYTHSAEFRGKTAVWLLGHCCCCCCCRWLCITHDFRKACLPLCATARKKISSREPIERVRKNKLIRKSVFTSLITMKKHTFFSKYKFSHTLVGLFCIQVYIYHFFPSGTCCVNVFCFTASLFRSSAERKKHFLASLNFPLRFVRYFLLTVAVLSFKAKEKTWKKICLISSARSHSFEEESQPRWE